MKRIYVSMLVALATQLTACSSAKPAVQSLKADLIVAGQITSTAERTFFEGDVTVIANMYEFAPHDNPDKPIKIMDGAGNCPPRGAGQSYLVFLQRHARGFALTASDDAKDFENMTNLEIAVCLPIDKQTLGQAERLYP